MYRDGFSINRYIYSDYCHIECGYTANQLQNQMPTLPSLEPRTWYFRKGEVIKNQLGADEVINEFQLSNYFKSIPVDSDDCGKPDILFYGPNTGVYHACAISESNMKRALIKRVLYGGNERLSSYDCYHKRKDAIKYLHEQFLPKFEPMPRLMELDEMFYDYVDNSKQINGKKRAQYVDMYNAIKSPEYVAKFSKKNDVKGMRVINCFQKCENYQEMKEPRAICACSTENKVYFAGILNQLQHYISNNYNMMVKSMNTNQIIARKMELAKKWSCFCGSDFSSYEGSQDYIWQRFIELPIFERLLANYPEVLEEFRKSYLLGHDIYYKNKKMCTLFGKRMSGDLHTSLGNSLCNYFIWSYAAYKTGVDFEILVEGDDAFIASDVPIDIKYVRDLGFDAKFEGPSTNPDDILFLSVYTVNGTRFGNIPKILDKIGVVKSAYFSQCVMESSKRKEKTLIDYIYTKAYCYQCMYKGTPILDPLLEKMMKDFPGHFDPTLLDEHFTHRIGKESKIPRREITEAVRLEVARIWPQYDIAYQLRIEEEIKNYQDNIFRIIY